MKPWNESAGWKAYKDVYAKVEKVPSVTRLDALLDRMSDAEPGLYECFPQREELVLDLLGLLDDRSSAKRESLQVSPGRQPRPDWHAELSESIQRLQHGYRALRRLYALGDHEPWIETTLLPEVRSSREAVASRFQLLEKALLNDPKTPTLAREARALLREVDEGLEVLGKQ